METLAKVESLLGKTISTAEWCRAPYGRTYDYLILLTFTDNSRVVVGSGHTLLAFPDHFLDLDPERLAVIFPNEGAATVDCPHAEFSKMFDF